MVTPRQTIVVNDFIMETKGLCQSSPRLAQAWVDVITMTDAGYWLDANVASVTIDCDLIIVMQKDHKQRAVLRDVPPL